VGNQTHSLFEYTFGHPNKQQLPHSALPSPPDALFDIASLTKITATLTCLMHLYDKSVIDASDLAFQYIPEYANTGKQNTTLQNLLLHNAGLL
jgi:CubicO group peptidase (beta-lactamase class C family)